MSNKPKVHVGIVGAGLGGLAAAIGIARAGHKVTVLEQAAVLGEVRFRAMQMDSTSPTDRFNRLELEFKSPPTHLLFSNAGISLTESKPSQSDL